MTIFETWEQYLGGKRSAAGSPDPGESGYVDFERQQRQVFESQAQDSLLTVHYTTGLAVGILR